MWGLVDMLQRWLSLLCSRETGLQEERLGVGRSGDTDPGQRPQPLCCDWPGPAVLDVGLLGRGSGDHGGASGWSRWAGGAIS